MIIAKKILLLAGLLCSSYFIGLLLVVYEGDAQTVFSWQSHFGEQPNVNLSMLYCRYNLSKSFQDVHQEPVHFLNKTEWESISDTPLPIVSSQEVRLDSLRMLLKFIQKYLGILGIQFWSFGGLLVGAHRFESLVPWDGDIDVQMTMEGHAKLWEIVHALPGGQATHGQLCEDEEHLCYMAPLTEQVYLIVAKFPVMPDRFAFVRFLDSYTGYFVESWLARLVDDDKIYLYTKWWKSSKIPRSDVFPLKKVDFEGSSVDVPHRPMTMLHRQYGGGQNATLLMFTIQVPEGGFRQECVVERCTMPGHRLLAFKKDKRVELFRKGQYVFEFGPNLHEELTNKTFVRFVTSNEEILEFCVEETGGEMPRKVLVQNRNFFDSDDVFF